MYRPAFNLLLLAGRSFVLIACMLLSAWSPSASAAVRDLAFFVTSRSLDYVLLGEVHDSEHLHSLRHLNLYNLAGALGGRAIFLVMEQFDVLRQADLDQFVSRLSEAERQDPSTAKKLAQAGGFSFKGWVWERYEPVLQLALRSGWNIQAANLSRQEAMAIARGGPTPLLDRFKMEWSAEESARLVKEIQDGHCGLLPESAIPGMVKAQQARDAQMATVLVRAREIEGRGKNPLVMLLAGNVHIRKDVGVPRYLRAINPGAGIFAWGFVETPIGEASSNKVFDEYIGAIPQSRSDPCEGLKEQLQKKPKLQEPMRSE